MRGCSIENSNGLAIAQVVYAHRDDPLGNLEVSTEAYGEATEIVSGLADRCAGGRLVSVMEGGYDLDALAASVLVHLEALASAPV
jgi:acetoin utilization deacetylase AcuC-like enzyme